MQNVTPLEGIVKPRDQEIVTFNVGGVKFQTFRSTLKTTKPTRLSDDAFLNHFYVSDRKEYFFDRDPDIFKALLNYLRTGALHLPSFICGPSAKAELEFWGVPQQRIEQCCWINYNEWNSTQEALKRLEHDRKVSLLPRDMSHDTGTCWERWRPVIWRLMNRSNSSVGAKIFGAVSLMFVLLSIFTFLAETTEPFDYYTIVTTSRKDFNHSTTTSMAGLVPFNVTTEKQNITVSSTKNSTNDAVTSSSLPGETATNSDIVIEEKIRTKHPALQIIDFICLIYFILEYIARLVFSPKTLKHAVSLLAVIDVLAILPDLIEFTVFYARPELKENVNAVGYITIIRVIRVLRIFRLVRHSAGLWILIYTLRASFSELLLLFWFMGLGILVFSSLIYYVEDRKNFESIPNGFWWALITMTTVGYGDMVPHTTLGKLVGSVTAMAGVLMIGFTVPALVNNFMLYYRHVQFAMHTEELEKPKESQNNNGHVEMKEQSGVTNGKLENNPLLLTTKV